MENKVSYRGMTPQLIQFLNYASQVTVGNEKLESLRGSGKCIRTCEIGSLCQYTRDFNSTPVDLCELAKKLLGGKSYGL